MSYSGQGVVGSPTSLAENFDTAFSSTVDRPPHNTEYRNVAGADRYDTARRKRVLEEGDRAMPVQLKVKKGNHSRTSEGASCSFTEIPELEHPRTFYHPELKRPRSCCPPVSVGPLPIKKRKFIYAPAGETKPGHHVVEQEVTVPPPPQQVPVQPQVFPGSSGTQLPHNLIEDGPSAPDHLLLRSDSDETEDDSDIDVVTVQFEQSQPRHPVTVVDLTQESGEEILDAAQHPAVSTAPPESPAASHFIPCSPPPRVVPSLVSPSSQYQYSGSEPAEVPSAPDHLLSSCDSDETYDGSDIEVVTVQFEQSQPRDPVTVVYLTQESDEEILDAAQHPAVSTAPPESPAASYFIPCSPPPRVVPSLVSLSSQYQYSGSEPAEVPSAPDHLLSSCDSDETDDDSDIEVVTVQFEQSQPRDPVTVVYLTQESDEEILDAAQHPAEPFAPPESPAASHFIPCSPPPRVVPSLVSLSSQYQYSGSEPAEVPSTPDHLLLRSDSDETEDDSDITVQFEQSQHTHPVTVVDLTQESDEEILDSAQYPAVSTAPPESPAASHFYPCSPPPQVVPPVVSPLRLPSSQYQYSGSEPAEVPSAPDHLLSSCDSDETDDDSDIEVVTVQFEQSQPRDPVTVVYLTQESDEEILDAAQHPAVSTAPPESPAASHIITCSPPPRVVPPVVSPFRVASSQYQCTGSEPAEVPSAPQPTADHRYNSTQSHPLRESMHARDEHMPETERRLRDTRATPRPVDYSQQPPVPTPHQPTVYSHPEGHSAMIPPPMVAPSLQAPDEQLMPIPHRNPTFRGVQAQRLPQWMYGNH
ncbi:hypothetical protein L9F63_003519 [Diploptera punctata]|uniref:Uncharacterized protein n=1 Tax=Diploptera punctata TaxID=6984 RepID=A0AAD7ZKN3_DIPPU|nr:hypothetical protein L9F63_003519 [Diploptera punctata]